MAVIKSTDLDFDTIKSNLKSYLQSSSEFTDYDFEASGLSNILDVLAYNSHINGLTANMAVNESFLGSAQLRSSVVSHAENLGYYPRSKTTATANITVTAETSDTTTQSATLPAYSTFTGIIDSISYTFMTTEVYTATNDGSGNFSYKTSAGSTSLPIKEGVLKTKTFLVGNTTDEQIYVIPDSNVDTSTISVKVYDTNTSSTFVAYTDIKKSVRITSDSKVYIIREVPNGYYELTFGEGNVLGKNPTAGNKIVITYLQTKSTAGNGASFFTAQNKVTVGSSTYTPTVTKVSNSAGGADKETISSIKLNAPTAFSSQQRMVTAEDYKTIITANYSSVLDDVIAWGGNDNVPAKYGVVFVSLKFKDSITDETKTNTKADIKSLLSENMAIMSIDTEYTDPTDTFVETTTTFQFDPDLSGDTAETTETTIQNKIDTYFNTNLNAFGKIFRRSSLVTEIDALSVSILNSAMTIKLQQRLTPTLNQKKTYAVNFPVKLADPDPSEYILTSTKFTLDGISGCTLRNVLGSNTLEVINASGASIKDGIGNYNAASGTVNLIDFEPSAIDGDFIKISTTPLDQSTVKPLRNYILKLDTDLSRAIATIDYQNTSSVIS
tara:strand:+ start:384 stop:2213 length:1830 start_codon:yes stop_codon:yes gene_type:complete